MLQGIGLQAGFIQTKQDFGKLHTICYYHYFSYLVITEMYLQKTIDILLLHKYNNIVAIKER